MSDTSQGPGWWIASDNKWYPPHLHPDASGGGAMDPPAAAANSAGAGAPGMGSVHRRRQLGAIVAAVVVAAGAVIVIIATHGSGSAQPPQATVLSGNSATSTAPGSSGGGVTPTTAQGSSNPGGPAIVDLEGDSIALTLAVGLSNQQAKYGLTIIDDGTLGCGVASGNPVMLQGQQYTMPPACDTFLQTWQANIAKNKPDVVAILAGRWEVVDRMVNGSWTNIDNPSFQSYLTGQLEQGVDVALSGGAQVVLFTSPYYDEPPGPNGQPYPESLPGRVDEWNAIVRHVASEHPGTVTVLDLNAMLDPGGKYANTVDGVPARCPDDGVHISWQGGELVAPLILPQLAHLAQVAWQSSHNSSTLTPVPPLPQPAVDTSPAGLKAQVTDTSPTATCGQV